MGISRHEAEDIRLGENMKLTEADVRGLAKLARERGERLDLRGRDLSGLGLYKADLSGADLREAGLFHPQENAP